jgi:hypothetical protein
LAMVDASEAEGVARQNVKAGLDQTKEGLHAKVTEIVEGGEQ